MKLTDQELRNLPKVELHCHLELCFRHSSLIEIGKNIGIEVPENPYEFRKNWLITEPMSGLSDVLDRFVAIPKFWSSEELIERLTFEACEDAFAQGVKIFEVRYAPTFIAEFNPHLSWQQIQDAISKGADKAKKLGMAAGVIGIIQRTLSLEKAKEVCDFIIQNKESFVGIDLADAEVGFDCVPFAPLFQQAKDAGLRVTVHSGEEDVPEGPQFVRNAIDQLGAERIGHGLQIIKDEKAIEYVKSRKIPLEICPTSNWLTNAVPSIEKHPIKKLMDQGVMVTINSDDPSIFGIELLDEYKLLRDSYNFTLEDFNRCNDFAAAFSFISDDEKKAVWPRSITNLD